MDLEWNSSEFGAKICIFTLFGVTSGITRRSSSYQWDHSNKSENTIVFLVSWGFPPLATLLDEIPGMPWVTTTPHYSHHSVSSSNYTPSIFYNFGNNYLGISNESIDCIDWWLWAIISILRHKRRETIGKRNCTRQFIHVLTAFAACGMKFNVNCVL